MARESQQKLLRHRGRMGVARKTPTTISPFLGPPSALSCTVITNTLNYKPMKDFPLSKTSGWTQTRDTSQPTHSYVSKNRRIGRRGFVGINTHALTNRCRGVYPSIFVWCRDGIFYPTEFLSDRISTFYLTRIKFPRIFYPHRGYLSRYLHQGYVFYPG